jgi:hypothetical protein
LFLSRGRYQGESEDIYEQSLRSGKGVDYLEGLPERPISEHTNDVTKTGLTQIEHALAAASEDGACRIGTD